MFMLQVPKLQQQLVKLNRLHIRHVAPGNLTMKS